MKTNAAPFPSLRRSVERLQWLLRSGSMPALLLAGNSPHANVCLDTIEPAGLVRPITTFDPSDAPATVVQRGSFVSEVGWKGRPLAGNRRLIVMSHDSGGSLWPQSDLARTLAQAGFIVASPEHAGDNRHDMSRVGPDSWTLRPVEVSHAIDAVADDPRFAALLTPDRVGVYGMSAGGHTALLMDSRRWSPASFARHCSAHMAEDFPACVGLFTRLKGNWLDLVKLAVAQPGAELALLRRHLPPTATRASRRWSQRYRPQPSSIRRRLAQPSVLLGLSEVRNDAWLALRFHVEAMRRACADCVLVAGPVERGHGSMLSPMPTDLRRAEVPLLTDPSGFDRRRLTDVHRAVTTFFNQNLSP